MATPLKVWVVSAVVVGVVCAMQGDEKSRKLIVQLKINEKVGLGSIVGNITLFYDDRVDSIMGACYSGNGVKVVGSAIYRLKVWLVLFAHGQSIMVYLPVGAVGLDVKHILCPLIAHRQAKAVGLFLSVNKYGVTSIDASGCRDGKCIG